MTDMNLSELQEEQISQCRIENAINAVLETVKNLRDRFPITNYEENVYNLEESAILMAINSHGLQQYDTPFQSSSSSAASSSTSTASSVILSSSSFNPSRRFLLDNHNLSEIQSSPSPPSPSSSISSPSALTSSTSSIMMNNMEDYEENFRNFYGIDHLNIMETAVSFAIENQGLSIISPNR